MENLKNLFKKKDYIELAYLFGSAARGKEGKLSDIDLGVYLTEILSKKERFEKRLELISDITSVLKTNKLDLIIMNDASISLNFEIIKANNPIFVRNETKKIDVEVLIMAKYLDRRYYEKRASDIFLSKVLRNGLTF